MICMAATMLYSAIPRQPLATTITVHHILALQNSVALWAIKPLPVRCALMNQFGDHSFNAPFDQLQFSSAELWFFTHFR